jgi:hypothetical protein
VEYSTEPRIAGAGTPCPGAYVRMRAGLYFLARNREQGCMTSGHAAWQQSGLTDGAFRPDSTDPLDCGTPPPMTATMGASSAHGSGLTSADEVQRRLQGRSPEAPHSALLTGFSTYQFGLVHNS